MDLMVKRMIGRTAYHFTGTGKNVFECIQDLQGVGFPDVPRCGLCNSDDLELTSRVADKFKYCGVRCRNCSGDVTFGRRQDNENVFFLRRTADGRPDWRPYNKSEARA